MKFTPWRMTLLLFVAMIIAGLMSSKLVIKQDSAIASGSDIVVLVHLHTNTSDKVFKYQTNRVTMHNGYYEFNSKGYNYKVPMNRTIIKTKN